MKVSAIHGDLVPRLDLVLSPDPPHVHPVSSSVIADRQCTTISNTLTLHFFFVGDDEDATPPHSAVLGPVLLRRVNATCAGDGATG